MTVTFQWKTISGNRKAIDSYTLVSKRYPEGKKCFVRITTELGYSPIHPSLAYITNNYKNLLIGVDKGIYERTEYYRKAEYMPLNEILPTIHVFQNSHRGYLFNLNDEQLVQKENRFIERVSSVKKYALGAMGTFFVGGLISTFGFDATPVLTVGIPLTGMLASVWAMRKSKKTVEGLILAHNTYNLLRMIAKQRPLEFIDKIPDKSHIMTKSQ